jgi:hypothetical protein
MCGRQALSVWNHEPHEPHEREAFFTAAKRRYRLQQNRECACGAALRKGPAFV